MRKRQSKPAISVKRVVISKLLKASSDAEILKSIRSGSTGINVTHSGQSLINVGGWIGGYSIYGLQRAEEFTLG